MTPRKETARLVLDVDWDTDTEDHPSEWTFACVNDPLAERSIRVVDGAAPVWSCFRSLCGPGHPCHPMTCNWDRPTPSTDEAGETR